MLSVQHKIFLWILYITGQIPVSYDHKLQRFYKTQTLKFYSLFHGISVVCLSLAASYIFIQSGLKIYTSLVLYSIYLMAAINFGSIAMLFKRLHQQDDDCEMFNEINQFYFKKPITFLSFSQKDIDQINSRSTIIILVFFFEILPYFAILFYLISLYSFLNNIVTTAVVTIVSISFWIFSLNFPMLMSYEILKNNISSCNAIFKNIVEQSKLKMTCSQIMIIKHDIEQLMKLHYRIIKVTESVTKYFSFNFLITMFIVFFNIIYHCYFLILYFYERVVLNETSEFDCRQTISFIFYILYYMFWVLICLKSPNQLISENNKLISTLQRIECSYFNEQLNLSVCFIHFLESNNFNF